MTENSGGIFTSCNFFSLVCRHWDRDAKIKKLVEAELEIEVGVELEEVSAMLNSRNPDLEELRMRLEVMEEKLMRLEPVMEQTGKLSQRRSDAATVPPHESKPSVPQQKVDKQKHAVAGSDSGESTINEKKGEGTSERYWPWLSGKRQAASSDVPAKTQ